MNSHPALALLLALQIAAAAAVSTYTSDDLRFTFTYPAFVVASDDAKPPVAPAQRAATGTPAVLDCTSFPLVAERDGGHADFDILMITRLDYTCAGSPSIASSVLQSMALKAVTAPLNDAAHLAVGRPVAYQLNHAGAVFIRATAKDGNATTYAAAACTLVQNNALCWTAFSSSEAHLAALLTSTIRFASLPPQPLVPASILSLPLQTPTIAQRNR